MLQDERGRKTPQVVTVMDDAFHALADGYRRQLLVDLLHDSPRRVSELSEVSWELAESNAELLDRHLSSRRTVPDADETLLRAHHVHLPMLAEYGFVEWDRDARVVTRGPRFDVVRPLLEFLDDRRTVLYESDAGDERSPSWTVQRELK